MIILGIETSCDETSASLVENGTKTISNVVASSVDLHIKTGGIIPEKAAREQVRSIIPVLSEALLPITKHRLLTNIPEVDAIAVTIGPGLIGSLLVGVETVRTLSRLWQKPIIPVNHLEAHIYANWITQENKSPKFPAVALVVSGGHTDLVLMEKHGKLKWIGGTRDDAAGEAFDKCARLLGLPYPGGPSIAKEAEKFKIRNSKLEIKLPRPMLTENNFDFSFSGLKTAVLRTVQTTKNIEQKIPEIAFEIQEAICDCLVEKTLKAVQKYKVNNLSLAGGVSANKRLREKFEVTIKHLPSAINFYCPQPKLCTDNAAAIASCAFFNQNYLDWQKVVALPELTIMGRCSII